VITFITANKEVPISVKLCCLYVFIGLIYRLITNTIGRGGQSVLPDVLKTRERTKFSGLRNAHIDEVLRLLSSQRTWKSLFL